MAPTYSSINDITDELDNLNSGISKKRSTIAGKKDALSTKPTGVSLSEGFLSGVLKLLPAVVGAAIAKKSGAIGALQGSIPQGDAYLQRIRETNKDQTQKEEEGISDLERDLQSDEKRAESLSDSISDKRFRTELEDVRQAGKNTRATKYEQQQAAMAGLINKALGINDGSTVATAPTAAGAPNTTVPAAATTSEPSISPPSDSSGPIDPSSGVDKIRGALNELGATNPGEVAGASGIRQAASQTVSSENTAQKGSLEVRKLSQEELRSGAPMRILNSNQAIVPTEGADNSDEGIKRRIIYHAAVQDLLKDLNDFKQILVSKNAVQRFSDSDIKVIRNSLATKWAELRKLGQSSKSSATGLEYKNISALIPKADSIWANIKANLPLTPEIYDQFNSVKNQIFQEVKSKLSAERLRLVTLDQPDQGQYTESDARREAELRQLLGRADGS